LQPSFSVGSINSSHSFRKYFAQVIVFCRKLVFGIALLLQLVAILSQDCCSCRRKLTLFLALLLQLLCAICWFAYWVCDQFSPVLSLEKEKKKQELSF
jgi:hypothetical protein